MAEVEKPRIAPGSRHQIGPLNAAIVWAIGRAAGGRPPHVFTTLARNRGLFRRWLWFAGGLMPGGKLPRRDTELIILRVAHNTDCGYEWSHHERLGQRAGLSAEEVERVRSGPERRAGRRASRASSVPPMRCTPTASSATSSGPASPASSMTAS